MSICENVDVICTTGALKYVFFYRPLGVYELISYFKSISSYLTDNRTGMMKR